MNLLFTNLFEFLNTQNLAILFTASSILAFLLGWLSRSFKVNHLSESLKDLGNKHIKLQKRLEVMENLEVDTFEENINYRKIIKYLKTKNKSLSSEISALITANKIVASANSDILDWNIVNNNSENLDNEVMDQLDLSYSYQVNAIKDLTAFESITKDWTDFYDNENVEIFTAFLDLDRIGKPDKFNKDDLTKLSNVNDATAKKLNNLDICNFYQIKNLNWGDVENINNLINFHPEKVSLKAWQNEVNELSMIS